jgi:hypothetical protein
MRWLGFVFIATAATVISPPFASAEPVRLVCEGEMRVLSPNGNANESYTLSLAIDRGAGTVEVGGWGTAPIISKPDDDTLVLMARPGTVAGPSSGSINRVTRMASINSSPAMTGFGVSTADAEQLSGCFEGRSLLGTTGKPMSPLTKRHAALGCCVRAATIAGRLMSGRLAQTDCGQVVTVRRLRSFALARAIEPISCVLAPLMRWRGHRIFWLIFSEASR